ncbi:partial Beta-xylosidase, partial [Anaerolineae bacterium]
GRGHADSLSFWVISDIFEESRAGDTPFHGGFGLINTQGLKKPSYHGYWFLSRLGDEILDMGDSFAVTRHTSGKISVLVWNYCHYTDEAASDSRSIQKAAGTRRLYDMFVQKAEKQFTLNLPGFDRKVRVQATRFDREHGSVLDAWFEMGSPEQILREDLDILRQKTELTMNVEYLSPAPNLLTLNLIVQPHGVTLVDISESAFS